MERIIHIQMDIEQRIFPGRIQSPVEVHVVLCLEVGRLFHPQRLHLVDDIVPVGIDILAVLPFLLLAENDRNRHEFAIFAEKGCDTVFLRKFILILVYVEGNHRSPVAFVAVGHLIFRRSVT